ncbi:ABC transporter family protein [Ralstonia insidiosa]|uniref:ABC transporter family protein n=1 Tax=Ralstonia insidiosa TaxID=190721 RepID=A0AAC9BDK8_9RALS|nr:MULTISPECIES: ABC transporter ATP-binding protein/permease [Ralstonia]ANH71756.1 ABC transporter family protein [Ralstonia insidiosa]EPX95759.1 ABC transporter ATP-binding protein [Ralstonia sp. AU12-08]MBY4706999.1 ABC transporter ATP-binding protein/permease [Ralstonia insidiosa]GAQ28064.1 ABC transporter ATP-binding protein [Ralstonia sp. NT80]
MTTPRTAATPDSHKDSIAELNVHHGRLNLSETWQLIKPFWVSEVRYKAWGLLALVVALSLFVVYMNVLYTDWNRLFYNALEQKDKTEFWHQLGRFSWIAALIIIASVLRQYYTMMLRMRWRTWITGSFVDNWLGKQAFYRLEQTHTADNPDQRIADDLRNFTDATLTLALGFLNAAVTLVSFFGILWAVSGPLAFALGGHDFIIPGYMVWFALLYSVLGSVIIHFVGRPLIGLSFQQERYEAYFRFLLVRVRENSESIALYCGEPTEKAILRGRFERIRANWDQLMDYTRRLNFASSGYGQFAIIFPFLVSAPRYFGGTLTLGGMMQVATAFGQVQGAMSWFVDNYSTLVSWKASTNRLIEFQRAMRAAEREEEHRAGIQDIEVETAAVPAIEARGLALNLPNHTPEDMLVEPFDMTLVRGERVLVNGPSGCGKSTLVRAVAGIWPYGNGQIKIPEDASVLFLPQRSYLPSGTLADALSYPKLATEYTAERLSQVLIACRLPALVDLLDEVSNWSLRLSPGEQQRLAFARALLQRPDYLFLDEATSALDEDTEAFMYSLMLESMPDVTIVSVAHRSTVARFHHRRLRYIPEGDPLTAVSYRVVEEPAHMALAAS